jgi:hypothetical protein
MEGGIRMHKVFISYHHENDQDYKEHLLEINRLHSIFIDASVDTGDISANLDDDAIREEIRDEYLKDSTVTIVLVGLETQKRKHVDWEIYSSMFDGKVNKKSGILVINLPSTNCLASTANHSGEVERLYPGITDWRDFNSRIEYETVYPYMPDRIIDNLLNDSKISVVKWDKIENDPGALEFLIDVTYRDRASCEYDMSRPLRRDFRYLDHFE